MPRSFSNGPIDDHISLHADQKDKSAMETPGEEKLPLVRAKQPEESCVEAAESKSTSVDKTTTPKRRSQSTGPPAVRRLSIRELSLRKSLNLKVSAPKNHRENKGRLALIFEAFHEFALITTFHGLRYILAVNIHFIRRFLWLCLVIFCFGVVIIHCLVKYKQFIKSPTVININKIYTDVTEFPAVTICNDNVFRISAALNHSLLNVIKHLFGGDLTLHDVYNAGVANLTLDHLDYSAGNRIENMLLSCKWQGKKSCDVTNFSTVLTDYGICFTFNGPDNPRSLIAVSSGSSRGLELVLNIEEYERMAGPKLGSGVHIFVQNKRDYPLVEQKGQAIAAGSYTFVALNLKKEKRLGQPYDNCIDHGRGYVYDNKYKYSMATCQVDCYVTFVVKKCGCKDYYLPGDAPVCTFVQYVICLRDAKGEYESVKDEVCQCYKPCLTEYLEPLFSYSALSKDAHSVLSPGEADRIMERFKRALDINEYYNVENQYKKSRYRNFTQSVNRLHDFYDKVFGANIKIVMDNMIKVGKQAELITMMSEEFLDAQMCIYEKGFVNTIESYDLKMMKEQAEDHKIFGSSILRKIKTMSESVDVNIREVLFILLKGDIHGRLKILYAGQSHLFRLAKAFQKGDPPVTNLSQCDNLKYFEGINLTLVIPKETLKMAVQRSKYILQKGRHTTLTVRRLFGVLSSLQNVSIDVFESESLTDELLVKANAAAANYSQLCTSYLLEKEAIQKEMIDWPTQSMANFRGHLNNLKKKCENTLSYHMNELNITYRSLINFKVHFKEYRKIIPVLNQYLMHFNVSKFKIAELFSDWNSKEVHSWMEGLRESISSVIDNYVRQLNKVLECYKELYQEIFKSNITFHAFELKGGRWRVSEKYRTSLFNETFESLNDLHTLSILKYHHTEHLALAQDIQMDAMKFTNQAVIDVKFYSKNFIFLNIFFSELSYTIIEQRVAFGFYRLIGNIGGTMGLLIGGSIVSLFEMLDFVICLCISLLKWTPED